MPTSMNSLPIELRVLLLTLIPTAFISLQAQLYIDQDIYIAPNAEMHVALPMTYFESGIVLADRGDAGLDDYGILSFSENSQATGANHNTHVNGFVRNINNPNFMFPIGHDAIFQPVATVVESANTKIDFAYSHVSHSNLTKDPEVNNISDEFYWIIKSSGNSKISLSWNAFSNIDKLTDNNINALGIGGYDGTSWKRIPAMLDTTSFHDGSPADLLSGSITTLDNIVLSDYSAFTLVNVNATDNMEIKVSDAITPDGDGFNDTWQIDNIENYPNAIIKVFNRQGQVVFYPPNNYSNDWEGNYSKDTVLPSASYLYVIDLDGDGNVDPHGWLYISR